MILELLHHLWGNRLLIGIMSWIFDLVEQKKRVRCCDLVTSAAMLRNVADLTDVVDGRDETASLKVRAQFMSRLADYIGKHGLTQVESGKRFGVNQSRISHLLNGRISMFSIEALIKMCDHAGITVTVSFEDAHARDARAGNVALL